MAISGTSPGLKGKLAPAYIPGGTFRRMQVAWLTNGPAKGDRLSQLDIFHLLKNMFLVSPDVLKGSYHY